jgi:Uma2 family endonuclease
MEGQVVAERHIGQIWTVEQYLEMERGSAIRHEFIGGRVYAMAGGTKRHSRISINACSILSAYVDEQPGDPCQVFNGDMKIRLANELDHVYPDASVSCDARDLADDGADYIRFPRLVVEVLSPSTQAYDRMDKFDLYRERGALLEYVLVDSRRQAVELRTRDRDDVWTTRHYRSDEDITLASIGLTVPVQALYRGVRL